MDSGVEVVIVVIGLIIVGIYRLVKAAQEARQRQEARRRLSQSGRRQGSQPQRPTSQTEPRQTPAQTPGGGSILQQFRDLIEAGREAERPKPTPVRPASQQPRVQPTPVAKPTPSRPARRVVRRKVAPPPEPDTPSLRRSRVSRPAVARVARAKQTKPGRRSPALHDILASSRSDLAKAVLLAEVLGRPVGMRRGRVPRYRT